MNIPIIDLAPLLDGTTSDFEQVAADFLSAYSSVGFAVVVNHGISPILIRNLFDASKQFHALPMRQKMLLELNHLHRGYIPINTSTDVNSKLAEVSKPNQSESFMLMQEQSLDSTDVQAGAYLAGPNQWPDLPGFRRIVSDYQDALCKLGQQLMQIACAAIGAGSESVMPAFEQPTTWLRLLRYPPATPGQAADSFGSAPHTDFGCLTLLLQDEVGGLQVMRPDGTWIDVPWQADTFIVNVGDMLHRWSNGVLKSTAHRVINPSGRERYSCPFFYDPHVSTTVAPLDCCVSAARPARWPAIEFGEFLRAELEAGYDQHQQGR